MTIGGDLDPSLGRDGKNILQTNDVFLGKNYFYFHAQKFWWPLFSHRACFSHFSYDFSRVPYLYCMKCHTCIWRFLHQKPLFQKIIPWWHLFFTLFVLSRASDNATSQNIGGRMHGPSPTSKFGGPSPSPPRSPPMNMTMFFRNRYPRVGYSQSLLLPVVSMPFYGMIGLDF